jgi:sulfonate dioxygenase
MHAGIPRGLTALHSTIAKVEGSRAAGLHDRRKLIETVHTVVRVSGWKSVYINPGTTRRMLGVPKRECDTILYVLFHQVAEMLTSKCASTENRTQLRSGITGSVLFLRNEERRVLTNIRLSLPLFGFWRQTRHALRGTPHGESPESLEEYERRTGKVAKERQ